MSINLLFTNPGEPLIPMNINTWNSIAGPSGPVVAVTGTANEINAITSGGTATLSFFPTTICESFECDSLTVSGKLFPPIGENGTVLGVQDNELQFINNSTGGVQSVQQGTNIVVSPDVENPEVSLSNTITGLTSVSTSILQLNDAGGSPSYTLPIELSGNPPVNNIMSISDELGNMTFSAISRIVGTSDSTITISLDTDTNITNFNIDRNTLASIIYNNTNDVSCTVSGGHILLPPESGTGTIDTIDSTTLNISGGSGPTATIDISNNYLASIIYNNANNISCTVSGGHILLPPESGTGTIDTINSTTLNISGGSGPTATIDISNNYLASIIYNNANDISCTVSGGHILLPDPLPSATSANENEILMINSSGSYDLSSNINVNNIISNSYVQKNSSDGTPLYKLPTGSTIPFANQILVKSAGVGNTDTFFQYLNQLLDSSNNTISISNDSSNDKAIIDVNLSTLAGLIYNNDNDVSCSFNGTHILLPPETGTGSVTDVSGTLGQIHVTNPTTTPVISFDPINTALFPVGITTRVTENLDNQSLGIDALNSITTGTGNIAIGNNALKNNTIGTNNIAIGNNTLETSIASNNLCIGNSNGQNLNINGYQNILIGGTNGTSLTSGNGNVSIGTDILQGETTGTNNIIIAGPGCLNNTSTMTGNIFIVQNSDPPCTGGSNVVIGQVAGNSLTNNDFCVIAGSHTAESLNSGSNSIIIGDYAGNTINTSNFNVIIGSSACGNSTSNRENVVIGEYAGLVLDDDYNTIIGPNAGKFITTGQNNVILGINSAQTLTDGSNNIIINGDATASTISNQIVLGNSNVTSLYLPGPGIDFGVNVTNGLTIGNSISTPYAYSLPITNGSSNNVLSWPSSGNQLIWSSISSNGTFMPTISFGGASVGVAYSLQSGNYSQTGSIVTFSIAISLTSKGSSTGDISVAGLPFSARAGTVIQNVLFSGNAITFVGFLVASISASSNTIDLFDCKTATGSITLDNTNFSNISDIFITGTYMI